jgi:hypothetical protein
VLEKAGEKHAGISRTTCRRVLGELAEDEHDPVRRIGRGVARDPFRYYLSERSLRVVGNEDEGNEEAALARPLDLDSQDHPTPQNTEPKGEIVVLAKPFVSTGQKDSPGKKKPEKAESPEELRRAREVLAGKFNYVHTSERAAACLEWAWGLGEVSLDTETTGLLHVHDRIRLVQLSADGVTWLVDVAHVPREAVAEILRQFEDKPVYVHNALFDLPRICRQFGIALLTDVRDTLVASRVAYPGDWGVEDSSGEGEDGRVVRFKHGLEDCLERELGVVLEKDKRFRRKGAWEAP